MMRGSSCAGLARAWSAHARAFCGEDKERTREYGTCVCSILWGYVVDVCFMCLESSLISISSSLHSPNRILRVCSNI